MKAEAHGMPAAADGRERASLARRTCGALLGGALLTGSLAAGAQETVVIGGDPAPGEAPLTRDAPAVIVNDQVLDALGASDPAPGTVYRLPETGRVVIERPDALLSPPPENPSSRLTVAPPEESATTPPVGKPKPDAPPSSTAGVTEPAADEPAAAPKPDEAEPATPKPAGEPAVARPSAPAAAPPAPAEPEPSAAAAVQPTPPPDLPASALPAPTAPPPATTAQPTQPAEDETQPASETVTASQPQPAEASESSASQSAALPGTAEAGDRSLLFAEGSAELSPQAARKLTGLAEALRQDKKARVELLAYAQGDETNASRSRRLSLSRALAVRAYLIEQGVEPTRMDVRALGSAAEGPADRVDILPHGTPQ